VHADEKLTAFVELDSLRKKDLSMLLLGRLIGDFSVNLERVRAWRVRLTASLSPVAAGD